MSDNIVKISGQKLVRLNWPATIGFFAICAFTMLNVNFFTRVFLQTEQALSVFYLLACLLVLFGLKFPVTKSIGPPGFFWIGFILIYLIVSTRMGLGIDPRYLTSPSSAVYRILTAQLITVAAAVGARHLMLAGKQQMTLRIAFGLTLAAALTIILAKFFPILNVRDHSGRVGGVFTDANAAGHALCYSAAIGFACVIGEKSIFGRMFVLSGLALLIPCLLLTNSRSSIVFMALLVMAQFLISPIMKQKGTIVAVLVLILGIPFGIQSFVKREGSHVNAREAANLESQQERLASFVRILRGEMTEKDTGYRFVLGALGLKYFASSPVIGVGFHKLTKMKETGLGCHNTFIRVLGEGGLFCGIYFALTFGFTALAGWKCKDAQTRCLVVGFVISYACSGMVAHTVLTSRISNVIMGICFGFLTAAITAQLGIIKKRRAETFFRQQQLRAHQAAASAAPVAVT